MKTKDMLSSIQDIVDRINTTLQSCPTNISRRGKVRIAKMIPMISGGRILSKVSKRRWLEVKVCSELPLGNYGRPGFLILDTFDYYLYNSGNISIVAVLSDRRDPDYVWYQLYGTLVPSNRIQEWELTDCVLAGFIANKTFV